MTNHDKLEACIYTDDEELIKYLEKVDNYDPKQAIKLYSLFIEKNQNNACIAYRRDDRSGGITYPGSVADYYCYRANSKREFGMFDEALEDCNQAISLSPDYSYAYNARGNAYLDKGEDSQALRDYAQAIAIDNNPLALYNYGYYYECKGQLDEAMRYYDRAILEDPADCCWSYIGRGVIYYEQGNYEKALDEYANAEALDPEDATIYFRRGQCYEKQGFYVEAFNNYTRTIELDPDYWRAYCLRGDIFEAREDYTAALADYSQAIAIKPDENWLYGERDNIDGKRHLKNTGNKLMENE